MSEVNWCRPCRTGWDPTKPKTYSPTCPECQNKVAKGLRTGKEPHPMTLNIRNRERMPRIDFMGRVARERAARAARRGVYAALVRP